MPGVKAAAHRWTDKALRAEVAKLDTEVAPYWDYRDELNEDSIVKILDEGLEGVDAASEELIDLNLEYLCEQKDREIDEHLESMRKRHPVSPAAEQRFRDIVEDSDKLCFSADLKGLTRRQTENFLVMLPEPYSDYQAYRGVQSTHQVEVFCKWFELLNVNPAHFQKWVTVDNNDRPSYDPAPVIFPNHPERDGHELVLLEQVHDIMNETTYGGQMVFLVNLTIADVIEHIEAFKSGPIVVKKGTWCFPYCTMNGAGPCAEMILQKDLTLPAGSFGLRLDSKLRYGVQSCYGFTGEPWKAGTITPT
jgi:hypothetical protein